MTSPSGGNYEVGQNQITLEANGSGGDGCHAHFGSCHSADPTDGFAHSTINGANDDDAEQVLLQHERAEPY